MAAEAIVSALLENLTSTFFEKIKQEVSLVVGADQEVEELKSNFGAIQAVLLDAKEKQVQENAVRHWLRRLKDTSYEIEDVLDDWNAAMLKFQAEGSRGNTLTKMVSCFSPFFCFGIKKVVLCHEVANRIKDLNKKLDTIASDKDEFNLTHLSRRIEKLERQETTSFDVDLSKICGRDIEKRMLLDKLLSESSSEEQLRLHVVSIVGMGGIGKTTLAQFVYHNKDVKEYFNSRIWVCVSDPFDSFKIAKTILEALKGDVPNLSSLNNFLEKVGESIKQKKFLLILDDVWTEDGHIWEPFYHCLNNNCLHGSRILVTTRKEKVAYAMKSNDINIIPINELSKKDSLLCFRQIAFHGWSNSETEEVEEIVEKFVDKCKGLPLAIKTIGSLLRLKKTRKGWESILNSETWKVKEIKDDIFRPLLLSYYDLLPMVKQCFLYCATYPKDLKLDKDCLIYLWMAQSYLGLDTNEMEKIGEEYLDTLVARSLIIKEGCDYHQTIYKMHDIIHDVALFISENECFTIRDDSGFEEPCTDKKIRHLRFISNAREKSPFPSNIPNPKKLRSLFIINEADRYAIISHRGPIVKDTSRESIVPPNVLTNFFSQLTYLKVLYLQVDIEEITEGIGKLIHLKNLQLVCPNVSRLPNSLWELYNLQTFDISSDFLRLSKGIGNLVNLRRLIIRHYNRDPTPKQIERLTCLRTLTTFTVGGDNLKALKDLNKLRGLVISRMEDATDASEVRKAEFDKKKDLSSLKLDFQGEKAKSKKDHEKIIEAVGPPSLEHLDLINYKGGSELPNWMISLKTLKNLRLGLCCNWDCLPPLGQMPSLESLYIWEMEGIERVSREFLGIRSGGVSSSSSEVTVFPKLKFLCFQALTRWKKWYFGITKEDEKHIKIMPHLCNLSLTGCGLLEEVPEELLQRATLQRFDVRYSGSPYLETQCEKWKMQKTGQDHLSN